MCRLGSYAEALATLERSDALNVASEDPYNRAEDLVFIALCHHELGDVTRAKALLREVRVLTADEGDELLADFVSEVAAALDGP